MLKKSLRSLRVVDRIRSPHVAWLAVAVFAAVAMVIGGVAVIIGSRLEEGIRDQGRGGAEATAEAFVSSEFEASDFRDGKLTPGAAANLTAVVLRSKSIEAVRLWTADYRLLYASPSMRLQRPSQPGEEFFAARRGETASEITSRAAEEASRRTSGAAAEETLIEVYLPVRRSGDDGIPYVLETYVPYRYVGSRVHEELRSLYLLLAGAVLLINLVMFPTLRRAVRELRETRARRHAELQRRLRRAMERDELVMHYQPKVDLQTGHSIGAEALLRWRQEDGSLLAPGAFLPQVEETEIMGPLTIHIAELAMRQCAQWSAAGLDLPVSVNLSSSNLSDPALPKRLGEMARRHAVATSAITFEVTETAAMRDPVRAVSQLTRLFELGFVLSIDDFGAGESSLSRLDQIPFSELKIDRALISPLEAAHNPTLVKAIISLAHQLGMKVVAEGVEHEHTPALLLDLGCDQAQGFFFSRPVAPDALAAAVRAHVAVTNGSQPHSALSEELAATALPR